MALTLRYSKICWGCLPIFRRSASNWKLLVAAGSKAIIWSGEGEMTVEVEVEAAGGGMVEVLPAAGGSGMRVSASEISSIFRTLALGEVERSPPFGSWQRTDAKQCFWVTEPNEPADGGSPSR